MKIDPYNHRERYLDWKEKTREGIPEMRDYNFQLLQRYLSDMERGLKIAK